MSLNDVSIVLAYGAWAWRWGWAKVIGSMAALHGEKATAGEMGCAFRQ